jgi:hypothetical protein
VADKPTLKALLTMEAIQGAATPANFRYGSQIHKRRGVEVLSSDGYTVIAWVGGLDGSVAEGGGQRATHPA